jgi:hypothetical protein
MESKLSISKINQAGGELITHAEKMYSSLSTIKDLIAGSKSYFDSPAGDQVRNKFNLSAEKFEEFKAFLVSYGEFLKTFSGNVQSFEDAVEEAAREISHM